MLIPEGARSYGEFGAVPEKYQDAIRAGLGFFECRLRMKNRWGVTVTGPFDVSVREKEAQVTDPTGAEQFQIRWVTEPNRPGVRFQPSGPKSDVSFAFIVDDPGWYNRVLLCDPLNSSYRAVAYHSQQGIVPAAAIQPWFDCLREVLYAKHPLYNVISKDNVLIENFRDEQAAKECMEAKDDDTGKLLHPRCWLSVTEVWDKTEDTKRMIRENRGLIRGWTDAVQFRTVIRPKVEKMIEERMGAKPTGFTLPQSLEDLRRMTPEQKRIYRELLLGDDAEEPAEDTRKKVNVHHAKKDDLIARAKELGVENPEAIPNRKEIMGAIISAQNGETNIPVGPMPVKTKLKEPEPEPEVVT